MLYMHDVQCLHSQTPQQSSGTDIGPKYVLCIVSLTKLLGIEAVFSLGSCHSLIFSYMYMYIYIHVFKLYHIEHVCSYICTAN